MVSRSQLSCCIFYIPYSKQTCQEKSFCSLRKSPATATRRPAVRCVSFYGYRRTGDRLTRCVRLRASQGHLRRPKQKPPPSYHQQRFFFVGEGQALRPCEDGGTRSRCYRMTRRSKCSSFRLVIGTPLFFRRLNANTNIITVNVIIFYSGPSIYDIREKLNRPFMRNGMLRNDFDHF